MLLPFEVRACTLAATRPATNITIVTAHYMRSRPETVHGNM